MRDFGGDMPIFWRRLMALSAAQAGRSGKIAAFVTVGLGLVALSGPAIAQDNADGSASDGSVDYLEGLKACQLLTEDTARLACFDSAVGNIVTASDTGDVQVVDREDVRETRRSLFGFSLPNIGIFGSDDDEEEELFETTIESVRYLGRSKARFTTAEGAVWELSSVPRRQRQIRAGDTVIFKDAALGTFFVRINGQRGIKGRRVE